MIIPVLNQLNSRSHWLSFFNRDTAHCFVEHPECLIDMQTTYLQLTLLSSDQQGRNAVKYSLGSRLSIEPVWKLIKACRWNLHTIIEGLEQLDFNSNVRDNSLLKAHTELTVRKFFNKDRLIVSTSQLGLVQPLTEPAEVWLAPQLIRVLVNKQFYNLKPNSSEQGNIEAELLILDILEAPGQWLGTMHDGRLHLLNNMQTIASLTLDLRPPVPRLKLKPTLDSFY